MALALYGIRNCDTVKKARAWLDDAGIAFRFHDYKAEGVAEPLLAGWVAALGWEALLNRAGTTFRKLPEADRADLDQPRAMALMLAHPSAIRRPVLQGEWQGRPLLLVGFRPEAYRAALGG